MAGSRRKVLNAAGGEESRFQEKFYGMRIDLPRTVVNCSLELQFRVYCVCDEFLRGYYKTVTCRG